MKCGPVRLADLFCGAGGTSAGAVEAIEALGYRADLTAINHWPVAVATHAENHPDARHLCTNIDNVNPREMFREGELDLLWASPECTHHSVARGGKPLARAIVLSALSQKSDISRFVQEDRRLCAS